MESKYESQANGLKIHTKSGSSGVDYSSANKKFRPSHTKSASSSPDSPLDDPFSDDEFNEDPLSDPKSYENATSIKRVPTTNQKPPPSQTMERNAYKIPSHVFARAKSTAPVEWSVASNDSLFSIHVGDSSFGRESSSNYNNSYKQSPMNVNIVQQDKGSESKEEEGGVETVKSDENLSLTSSVSCHSNLSDMSHGSVRSFAFPILTESNNGKDGSRRIDDSVRIGFDYSSKPLSPTTPKKQPLSPTTPKKQPLPQQKPEQSKDSTSSPSSWFGWFTCSCCTTCLK